MDWSNRVLSGNLCACGCGRKTYYAQVTNKSRTMIKGTPLKYFQSHGGGRKGKSEAPEGFSCCTNCREIKSIDNFYKRENGNKLDSTCSPCNKKLRDKFRPPNFVIRYNISQEKYLEMFTEQAGVCAICKQEETRTFRGTKRLLCVDHNHETNKIRGLLCTKCNAGLGQFKDNVKSLKEAISYLNKHEN